MFMSIEFSQYTSRYRSKHTIIHALAWGATREFLHSVERDDIYKSIKTITIRGGKVTIKTESPLLNTEILILRESLLEALNARLTLSHVHVTQLLFR